LGLLRLRERPRPTGGSEGVGAVVLVGELVGLREGCWAKSLGLVLAGGWVSERLLKASPTQESQRIQPRTVPVLPKPTTLMGETRCW